MEEQDITISYGGDDTGDFGALEYDIDRLNVEGRNGEELQDNLKAFFSVWEDRTAPWEVTVTWHIEDGRAVPVGLALKSRTGQRVTPEAWRSVRVTEVIDESRRRLQWQQEWVGKRLEREGSTDAAATAQAGAQALGRRGRFGDAHYRRVADLYNSERASGSTRPMKAIKAQLAEEMKTPALKQSGDYRVKGWITEARKRGLIGEGK